MAAPLRIGFGSRKIWTEHIKNYQCTDFHAFVQICTFPHENPPKYPNYAVFEPYYVAAKATYIRLLHGKIGILEGFFGPSSVQRGRTQIVLG